MIQSILNVTTNTTVGPLNISRPGRDNLTVQVSISAAATVSVQGRVSKSAPWVELASLTVDGVVTVPMVSYLQFVIILNTGTVEMFVLD